MRVTTAFNRLLDLDGVNVVAVGIGTQEVIVEVRLRRRRLTCPLCDYSTAARYDTRREDSSWRHPRLSARRLVIKAQLRRLACPVHGVRVEGVPFARPGARFTRDFEQLVAWCATKMQKPLLAAIEQIDEDVWVDIEGYIGARAQVAETLHKGRRLVVRRTLNESDQPTLVEDWRHHAFLTNLTNLEGDLLEVDRTHRAHAVVELAIRDLKHDAGMIHMPSGIFQANAAWTIACTLAHNLVRWTQLLTAADSDDVLRTSKTFRRRMLRLPGRLVRSGRRWTLRHPRRWPWRTAWQQALADLRDLPQPC